MAETSKNPAAEEQRKIGVKLATQFGATKTLALIKNQNVGHAEILRSAAEEIGNDKLTEIVLGQSPEWAFHTLRSVPNLGDHAKALSAQSEKWTAVTSAPVLSDAIAAPIAISGLELKLIWGSVMYSCWFTMFWQNPVNVTQPVAAYGNSSKWVWSPKMDISYHPNYTFACSHFALPLAQLAAGNSVWMRVQISGGGGHDIGMGQFVYDPNATGATLTVEAGGTTLNPTFKID